MPLPKPRPRQQRWPLAEGGDAGNPKTPRQQGQLHQQGYVAFATCGQVTFPEPEDRNVNMLPFVIGDKSSLASNLSNTSHVLDALVDKHVPGIVDKNGGCEHLRPLFGPGTKLQSNQLIWMTDCTPREALEQERDGYRQFFRVESSRISHWFAQHSTPNPRVPLPDNVVIVHDNKFHTEV